MDASLVNYIQQLIKQNPSTVPDDVREAVESANRGESVPGPSKATVTHPHEDISRDSFEQSSDSPFSDKEAVTSPETSTDPSPVQSPAVVASVKSSTDPSPVVSSATVATVKSKTEPEAEEYTVEMYFSKTMNPAKRNFRHVLRTAATEAKAYKQTTFSLLTTKQKHWIHDRVIAECPQLRGYERKVDDVLMAQLLQARNYQKRKRLNKIKKATGKKVKDGKSGEVKEKLKGDDDGCKRVKQKKSKGGDDGSEHVKRNKSKRGDDGKKKSKTGDDGSEPVKRNKSKRGDDGKKKSKEPTGEYERMRQRNMRTMKAVMEATMKMNADAPGSFKPGDIVVVYHNEVDLAKAYFISATNDMYAEIILHSPICMEDVDVELPSPVEDKLGRKKTTFSELEVNDKFMWKMEKMRPDNPSMTTPSDMETREPPPSKRSLRTNRDPPKRYE